MLGVTGQGDRSFALYCSLSLLSTDFLVYGTTFGSYEALVVSFNTVLMRIIDAFARTLTSGIVKQIWIDCRSSTHTLNVGRGNDVDSCSSGCSLFLKNLQSVTEHWTPAPL